MAFEWSRQSFAVLFALHLARNHLEGRQQFIACFVLTSIPDWSEGLLNFENVVKTPLKAYHRTVNDARFFQPGLYYCERQLFLQYIF